MPITASLGALTVTKRIQQYFPASAYWAPTTFPIFAPKCSIGGGLPPNINLVNWQNTNGYTVEYWIYVPSFSSGIPLVFNESAGPSFTLDWKFGPVSDRSLRFTWLGSTSGFLSTAANLINANTWTNICFVCDTIGITTTITMFINGIQQNIRLNGVGAYTPSYSITTTATLGEYYITFGVPGNNVNVTGNIDQMRVSSIARYNSNYTPQRTLYTNDANTELIMNFAYDINENPLVPTFGDSSGHNYVPTNYAPFVAADLTRFIA